MGDRTNQAKSFSPMRRRLGKLLLASPVIGAVLAGCTQESREQIAENLRQTAWAAGEQTAAAIVKTGQAEVLTRLPSLPSLGWGFEGLPIDSARWNVGFGATIYAQET